MLYNLNVATGQRECAMKIDNQEATRLFDYASKLYAEEKYAEALAVLDELHPHRRQSRRVIFARADCFFRLENFDEALHICDELIAYHDYDPAKKLRVKLENRQLASMRAPDPGINPFAITELDMDFDFDLPATKVGPPPKHIANAAKGQRIALGKNTLFIIAMCAIILIIGGACALYVFLQK